MLGGLTPSEITMYLISLIIAMVLHEFMHGFVAFKLGDTTAMENGRLSFNPMQHIDPFMTIILPAITLVTIGMPFMAAKPVPFNPARLKYDDYGAAIMAAAGPLTNLALAIVGVLLLNVLAGNDLTGKFLGIFIGTNVSLFVFNLLPIPPLDGSRIIYAFAPESVRNFFEQIEPFGLFIVFGLLLVTHFTILININQMVINLISHL